MAYKQPRVPPLRDGMNLYAYIRDMVLFLKDFCMETWTEHKRLEAQVQALQERIRMLEGGENG